jgi:preprotein translocase subunit YajC
MLNLFTTVAHAAEATGVAPDAAAAAGSTFSIVWIVVMFVVFYFVLIRPQKKQEKKMKEMLAALQVGDKVITAGGIAGKIVKIKDDFVWLETGFVGNPNQQATLKLEKAAIKIVETIHDEG